MQINLHNRRLPVCGFALIMTLLTIGVSLIVFASLLIWAMSTSIVIQRNNQFNMSENAAQAAVEDVIGHMDYDFINASLSNATAYASLPATINQSSWPVTYTFSNTNGSNGVVSVVLQPVSSTSVALNSQYTGLMGYVQSNDVYATATPVGQSYTVPATVHESLQFATIPLFQFAIFYNVNLEIDPGAAMTVSGPVFCNQNIWEGSSSCTFSSRVTAVGTNCQLLADPFATNYNGSGQSTYSMAGQPVNGADALVMPIGTNNNPSTIMGLLNLPPAPYNMGTALAYGSSNGLAYPANSADLYITNYIWGTNFGVYTPVGTNLAVFFQDQTSQSLTQLPYDQFIMTNRGAGNVYITNNVPAALATNLLFAGFSWLTNVMFYDWREGWNGGSGPAKPVQAVQIDLALLNTWLTNYNAPGNGYTNDQTKVTDSHHHIGGLFVYNSVPPANNLLPAVRLIHGAQLPNPGGSAFGLTVATPFPLYVYGNYNSQNNGLSALGQWGYSGATSNTLPAALMGDSITILSTNWHDGYTSKLPTGTVNGPGNTTVNAAMLEGIVPSNPNISGNYSGGVENFMRLLEDWGSGVSGGKQVLTYNGSIVVLFYSQYATNSWQPTGNYYNPPTRDWAFDMNFENPNKLPPLVPGSRAMIRGNWYAHQ